MLKLDIYRKINNAITTEGPTTTSHTRWLQHVSSVELQMIAYENIFFKLVFIVSKELNFYEHSNKSPSFLVSFKTFLILYKPWLLHNNTYEVMSTVNVLLVIFFVVSLVSPLNVHISKLYIFILSRCMSFIFAIYFSLFA